MVAASPELNALLKRCRETPADDMPRLVLADWLDENGDADRAAFIRVQIALSHPSADGGRHRELKALERALLTAHFEEWIGELSRILGPLQKLDSRPLAWLANNESNNLCRGLIRIGLNTATIQDPMLRIWVRSQAGDWLESVSLAEVTLATFERETLPAEYSGRLGLDFSTSSGQKSDESFGVQRVTKPTQGDWHRYFHSANFRSVRSIVLDGDLDVLRALGEADLSRLVELTIKTAKASEAARVLMTIPFQSLTSLNFGPVNEAAVRDIAASPFMQNLSKWQFKESRFGDGGMIALCESPMARSLTEINFANTGIGDAGVQALVRSPIFANMNSPSLKLMMNRIGDAGVRALAESEHLLRYRELSLRENSCGDAGAAALAASEFAASLTFLDFWRNRIGDAGAVALSQSEHLGKIVDLCVKENAVGPDGAAALFERFTDRAKV